MLEPSKGLSVVSIGYTRSLWEDAGSDDSKSRMIAYASYLEDYVVIVNSYRSHRLREALLGTNLRAIPTDAFTPVDSFAKMLTIGFRNLRGRERGSVLIQAQDPIFTGVAAIMLGRLLAVPVNICVYGSNVFDKHWIRCSLANRLLAPLGRWALRNAQGVQVDGRMTGLMLEKALEGKPVHLKPVIPINLDRFLALSLDRSPDAKVSLLFVGRLERQKNLPMLAAAFRKLVARLGERKRDVVLEIVGKGSGEKAFRESLADLSEAGLIKWHGQVAHEDIPERFGCAGILLLSSFFEGYPRVLMEAAAAGLPIVTTAVSGSDEAVLDGESGFIVPIGDAEAFADRVARLVLDPALRAGMAAKARSQARASLDPSGNLERQIEIWESFRARGSRNSPGAQAHRP